MKYLNILAFGMTFIGSIAIAEESDRYNGKWHGHCGYSHIRVELKGNAGTYGSVNRYSNGFSGNPCPNLDSPVDVIKSEPDKLVFLVSGSRVLTGCPNFRLFMKPVDKEHLKGSIEKLADIPCELSRD